MAPVALYPDALLAKVLTAATYPLEVVLANQQRRQARLGFLSPASFERWFYEKRLAA